jgi:hypothetical protein
MTLNSLHARLPLVALAAFVLGSAAKTPEKTPDGCLFLDPARFFEDFAADLPREQAEFEAHSQMFTAAKVFTTPGTSPAWKLKPSWALVATADRIINPARADVR